MANTDSTKKKTEVQTASKKSDAQDSVFSSAGLKNILNTISIPELAIIGAAGFVVWKNRSKIQGLLEKNGIDVPFLNADAGQLVQSGLNYITGRKDSEDQKLHS